METVLLTYANQEFRSEIVVTNDAFELRWTDYVANEWREPYAELPVAVARLAVLIDAVERDEFMHLDSPEFAREARGWLDHMA